MEQTQILNVIGLSMDFIGVTMLFIWAPIQPNLEDGFSIGLEDSTLVDGKTVSYWNEKKRKQNGSLTCGLVRAVTCFRTRLFFLSAGDV